MRLRVPSNRMPKYVAPESSWISQAFAALYCFAMLVLFIALMIIHPEFILVMAGLIGVLFVMNKANEISLHRKQRERSSDSICTFARSFDCRAIDTWIIRAIYEEITSYVQYPIRANDDLEDDLIIDDEDWSGLIEVVAQRTGRSFDDCCASAPNTSIQTVRDLIHFLQDQPLRSLRVA